MQSRNIYARQETVIRTKDALILYGDYPGFNSSKTFNDSAGKTLNSNTRIAVSGNTRLLSQAVAAAVISFPNLLL